MDVEASELLKEIYSIAHRLEGVSVFNRALPFNDTEMQMMKEIVRVNESGGRIISSKLAKSLCITRSAGSQMVTKLEARGVVRRVPEETKKKIAYIELSDSARCVYEKMKEDVNAFLTRLIERLGERKVSNFVKSSNEFMDAFDEVFEEYRQKGCPIFRAE